jgi:biotin carboxyl carrier protein
MARTSVRLQGMAVLPPQAMATVSAPVAGFVQTVLVSPTDRLRAGQAVASLHSSQLMEWQRDYIQLDVQARQAQDRLQRSERLAAEGIVAESRVREDRYAHTQAQIAAQERRQALHLAGMGEAQLKALVDKPSVQANLSVSTPRAGTVLEVLARPGQRVDAGSPLITLARSGWLVLELQATVAQSQHIRAGAVVTVVGCTEVGQEGRVKGIAALMQGGNQAVMVHVSLPPSISTCLRANQAVEADVAATATPLGKP